MKHHVDGLADAAGVTPDTVLRYQDAGLLPRPAGDAQHAWYDDGHRDRVVAIAALEADGVALSRIADLLDTDPADAALVAALTAPPSGQHTPHGLTAEELAAATDLPVALLEALEREELLTPRRGADGTAVYTAEDAEALRAGMALLGAGVPLDELFGLARRHDEAMRAIAEEAVDLFVRFVRDPIQGTSANAEEASARLVGAFEEMLPATSAIIAHHFRRLLLAAATDRIAGGS